MPFRKRAKGTKRPTPGDPNPMEKRFGEYLESLRTAGKILWFKFEAIKLRLADKTFYTADYFVMTASCELHVIECKAGFLDKTSGKLVMLAEDDSKVKVKVIAEMFPFRFFFAVERPAKAGRGFQITEVNPPEAQEPNGIRSNPSSAS